MRPGLCLVILLGLLVCFIGPAALASSDGGPGAAQKGEVLEEKIAGEMEEAVYPAESAERIRDLIWRAINALAVVLVLFFLLRKPLSQALANRRRSIEDDLENLEKRKEETQRALEEALVKLKAVEAEKDKIVQEFLTQGEVEKARILAEAEDMALRLKEQARRSIEQETAAAKTQLQEEIAELSVAKALEMIKVKITPDDRDRLVNEYLNKVAG